MTQSLEVAESDLNQDVWLLILLSFHSNMGLLTSPYWPLAQSASGQGIHTNSIELRDKGMWQSQININTYFHYITLC